MYKYVFAAALLSLVALIPVSAEPPKAESVVDHLLNVSVTIRAGNAEGSGVVTNIKGVNYVWTAGHVVEHLRNIKEVIDPRTGTKRTVVEFDDAEVVKEDTTDGRKVGQMRYLAKVIKFSSANGGEDLALLRIRKKNLLPHTVVFNKAVDIPGLGTDLYHVGSLLGQMGSNSITTGIYSQVGRLHENVMYDQTSCSAFPGSSGGGVFFKKDGTYVGMLVRGAGETFNLIVPTRRMHEWAKKCNLQWALDYTVPVPSDDELDKVPPEDVSGVANMEKAATKPKMFPFMIRKLSLMQELGIDP
jgi:hypothetical protein